MKKIFKIIVSMAMVFSMAACSSSDDTSSASGTYSIQVTGYDWGPAVDKVIVKLDTEVESISAETFTVSETKEATDWTAEDYPVVISEFEREVTNAYLSDENGNEVDSSSEYVTLELYVSPNDGSPFLYTNSTMFNTWADPYELTITLAEDQTLDTTDGELSEVSISVECTGKTTNADAYVGNEFTSSDEEITMNYGLYEADDSDTLFVWLHGFGEGGSGLVDGTDYLVTALGNKVTAYISDEFQEAVGGANVLVPQCPTYWNDPDGSHNYTDTASVLEQSLDGTSYYTEALKELIDQVKEETGSTKVVISGCSAGGFMTMNLAINYGDEFDAYIPIAEGYATDSITDEQISELAELNMYFIYSEDDSSVDPSLYSTSLVDKLLDAGATNVKEFASEHVVDTSGLYTDEDGNAYQYNGHWSWIYFDNNEADANDGSGDVWSWIAEQVK